MPYRKRALNKINTKRFSLEPVPPPWFGVHRDP
jgi:hypothetical protein